MELCDLPIDAWYHITEHLTEPWDRVQLQRACRFAATVLPGGQIGPFGNALFLYRKETLEHWLLKHMEPPSHFHAAFPEMEAMAFRLDQLFSKRPASVTSIWIGWVGPMRSYALSFWHAASKTYISLQWQIGGDTWILHQRPKSETECPALKADAVIEVIKALG